MSANEKHSPPSVPGKPISPTSAITITCRMKSLDLMCVEEVCVHSPVIRWACACAEHTCTHACGNQRTMSFPFPHSFSTSLSTLCFETSSLTEPAATLFSYTVSEVPSNMGVPHMLFATSSFYLVVRMRAQVLKFVLQVLYQLSHLPRYCLKYLFKAVIKKKIPIR